MKEQGGPLPALVGGTIVVAALATCSRKAGGSCGFRSCSRSLSSAGTGRHAQADGLPSHWQGSTH